MIESKRTPLTRLKKIDWSRYETATRLFVFGLVVLLGLTYVFVTNNVATGGFALDDLRARVAELKTTNRQLELHAAELTSLSRVESAIHDLSLVQSDAVEYLETGAGAVAVQAE